MKPLPPIFNFVPSWRKYASTTSRSGCTNESKLKTKSTDESGIIDRERPSFRTQRTCETIARLINGPQLVAVVLQIMRPPPEPGRDFQNCPRRQTLANPRKNCAGPLRARVTPWFRPFLARLFPI